MKAYYVTTTENPKVLKFDVDTMYVYENGWKPSIYWRDKILVSDYVHFEEITEEKFGKHSKQHSSKTSQNPAAVS